MSARGGKRAAKPGRRAWKWIRRTIYVALVLVALLIGLVLVLARTDYGREQVRSGLVDTLAEYVDGSVAVGSIRGNLLGDFSVHGVDLRDSEGKPAIAAEKLSAKYRLGELVDSVLHVEELHLVRPSLDLRVDADGNLIMSNLFVVPPAEEPEEPSAWVVQVDDLWIQEARVDLSELVPELGVIDELTLRGKVRVAGDTVTVELSKLEAHIEKYEQRVAGHVDFRMQGARMDASLALEGQGARISIPTAMFVAEPASLVAAVLVHVEPELLARFAPEAQVKVPLDASLMVASEGLTEFSVLSGVSSKGVRVALAGTADASKNTVSGGLAVSPVRADAVSSLAPEMDLRGARVVGVLDKTAQFGGLLAGRVSAFGVAEQRIDAFIDGSPKGFDGGISSVGGGASLAFRGGLDLTGEVPKLRKTSVEARIPDLKRLVGRAVPVRGRLRASMVAKGHLDDIDLRGEIAALGTGSGTTSVDELRVDFRGKELPDAPNGMLRIKARGLKLGEQRIQEASTTLSVDKSQRLRGDLRVVGAGLLAKTQWTGQLDLEREEVALRVGSLSGRYRSLAFAGTGGAIDVGFDGSVDVKKLRLKAAEGTIALGARVDPRPAGSQIHLDLEVLGLELKELAKLAGQKEGIAGRASLMGNVDLGPQKTAAELQVVMDATAFDYPPLKAALELRLAKRRLKLSLASDAGQGLLTSVVDAEIRTPRDITDARAWSRAGRDAVESIDVLTKVTDLGGVTRWFPELPLIGGQAAVALRAEKGGRTASLRVDAVELLTLWTASPSRVHLNGDLEGTELEIAGAVQAAMMGSVGFDGVIETPTDIADMKGWSNRGVSSLQRLELRIKNAWPTPELWALLGVAATPRGRADLAVEILGQDKIATVRGEVTDVLVGPLREPGAAVILATLGPKEARVDTQVSLGKIPIVDVATSIGLGFEDVLEERWDKIPNSSFTAQVSSSELDLHRLSEMAGLPPIVGGRGRFSGRVSGTYKQPRGRIDVAIGDASYEGVELRRAVASLEVTDKVMSARLEALQAGGGNLDVEASTEWNKQTSPKRSLKVLANDFEVGLLAGFGPPSVRGLGGRLFGNLKLLGSGDELTSATGSVELRGGKVSMDGPLRRLQDVEVNLKAQQGSFRFRASARAGDGTLAMHTRIKLAGLIPETLTGKLTLKRLPLATSAGILELSLKTELEGEFERESISFDLTVKDGLVVMPKGGGRDYHGIGAPTDVVFVSSLESGLPVRRVVAPSPLPPIEINVDIPQTVSLRGESLNGVLGANLDITVHKGRTEFMGYAELLRGWVKIFRHRYDVEKALASFDATRDFNPRVDVVLNHEFKTAQFTVLIQGDLNDPPKPEFRAEPAIYDDAQLLSFFLGGSPDNIGQSRSGSARAAGAATSLVTSQLTGIVQEIIPMVDVLSLESSDESATPDQLLAGNWLTEKVLLAYRARLSSQQDQRSNVNEATIEWWFLKRWVLQAFYGDRQVGAADVLWIRRF